MTRSSIRKKPSSNTNSQSARNVRSGKDLQSLRIRAIDDFEECYPTCGIGDSLIDIVKRKPFCFTLKEACSAMEHCSVEEHEKFMKSIILTYSVQIHGLPEYPPEDVELAVFLFLEDTFGVRADELALCVDLTDGEKFFTGVVFESRETRLKVLSNRDILKGTAVQIISNFDIMWILDGFSLKKCEKKDT